MRSSNLPWRRAVLPAALLFSVVTSTQASSSINVDLQTSFSAGPFLVELLFATPAAFCTIAADLDAGRPQLLRTRPPTSLSSTALPMASSRIYRRSMSCMPNSSMCCSMRATSRPSSPSPLSSSPSPSMLPRPGSRRIFNIITPRSSLI
jgi:hypothetical protein